MSILLGRGFVHELFSEMGSESLRLVFVDREAGGRAAVECRWSEEWGAALDALDDEDKWCDDAMGQLVS